MDFNRYFSLISDSAAETGYEKFMPSICVVGDKIEMNVLETELSPNGDEEIAKEWASQFVTDESIVYLAYRSGERIITVIQIEGTEVTRKQGVKVQSFN